MELGTEDEAVVCTTRQIQTNKEIACKWFAEWALKVVTRLEWLS